MTDSIIGDEAETPESSIFYEVRVRRTDKGRVVVSLRRGDYEKDLAHLDKRDELRFLSKKPRHFFDDEDERRVLKHCLEFSESSEERVGSIELGLFLQPGPRVEVRFVGGAVLGVWTPGNGFRFEQEAHPVFKQEKDAIALHCWQVPQGTGGVFTGHDFSTEPSGVLSPRR